MGSKPTILDVAHAAGVSKGLVSFALNNRPGVSDATRERILKCADDLGYRRSVAARSLSTSTSFAVGLVIARDPGVIAADPFFPAFISGVERVLAERGWTLVLAVAASDTAEDDVYRMMAADGRVDGVFLTDLRTNDPRPALLADLGLPGVTLGRLPDSTLPAVMSDDTPGITAAVQHLVDLGHRRIAHVAGPPRMLHAVRRRDAFLASAADHGLTETPVIETDFSAREGAEATHRLLDAPTPPTAIVYANDPMAIAGLSVAHERGLQLPADLSITGFDDSDMAHYVFPTLTSVRTRPVEWGEHAARSLLALVEDGEAPDVDLPVAELMVKKSTATTRS